MTGIEGKNSAGSAQTAGADQPASTPAQRREVPAEEAHQFSRSLAKDGDKGGNRRNASSQHAPGQSPHRGDGTLPGGPAQRAPSQPAPPGARSLPGGGADPRPAQVQQSSVGSAQPQSLGKTGEGGENGAINQLSTSGTVAQQSVGGALETAVAAPAPRDSVSDLAEKLASRILASRPESGGAEVRIELSMNKLQGAVITMRQDVNGLSIVFDAPSPEVAGRLAETRGDLVQRLQNATGENVSVDIKEHDAGRDQQPGDGRSRNQYEAETEEEGGDD
ncbi:MAG: hypothetical protein AAF936_08695 [Pseudomonadota bacterium]